MRLRHIYILLCFAVLLNINNALADSEGAAKEQSFHMGLMHPNGVDLAGYSVEKKFNNELSNNIYHFYNFGFPSLAATGFSFYENRNGNGFTATAGVGIGFVMYGSAAYQLKIDKNQFIKLGAGLGFGILHSGLFTVISYEHRFKD